MSLILSILLFIVVAGFLVFIGLGLALAFGILIVGVILVTLFSLIFGQGFSCSPLGLDNSANKLPQQFNQCLLTMDPELCRTQFTVWTPEESKMTNQLAKQVREDLGERLAASTRSLRYSQSIANGDSMITIDEESDFAKKEGVREHYVIVKDQKDKAFKIKELNWDYAETPRVQNP